MYLPTLYGRTTTDISPKVIETTLAAEDKRFYKHTLEMVGGNMRSDPIKIEVR